MEIRPRRHIDEKYIECESSATRAEISTAKYECVHNSERARAPITVVMSLQTENHKRHASKHLGLLTEQQNSEVRFVQGKLLRDA